MSQLSTTAIVPSVFVALGALLLTACTRNDNKGSDGETCRQDLIAAESGSDTSFLPAFSSPYFVFIFESGPNWVQGKDVLDQDLSEHFAYMSTLESTGVLVHGGPLEYGDGGMAIGVLQASSLPEAEKIVRADPAIQAGVQQIVLVSRWLPLAGSGACVDKSLVRPQ